ncbi:MAG: AAA family ATPase [Oligoflexia bacterium]|nr:AAA family ATPase [Oligoflexia bacterium]
MSIQEYFSAAKISKIFSCDLTEEFLLAAEKEYAFPPSQRYKSGATFARGWPIAALPYIGEKWGFLGKFPHSLVVSIFTTKGGVLKTTLTQNLARVAALHGIKTLVIGLDMQGDITTTLGHNQELEEIDDIQQIMAKINETKGLADIFNHTCSLGEIVYPTKIPTLFYIPETPELASLNETLSNINRREYWLQEKIITPLREEFDLIIMDCSPNWNRLITNALVSSDILLSPLECKINNFRNFRVFRHFINEFRREMRLNFGNIFIPTRYAHGKKLSMEIKEWYTQNVQGCTENGIREGVMGEEAQALKISLIEYAPNKDLALEIKNLLIDVQQRILSHLASLSADSAEENVPDNFSAVENSVLTTLGVSECQSECRSDRTTDNHNQNSPLWH